MCTIILWNITNLWIRLELLHNEGSIVYIILSLHNNFTSQFYSQYSRGFSFFIPNIKINISYKYSTPMEITMLLLEFSNRYRLNNIVGIIKIVCECYT